MLLVELPVDHVRIARAVGRSPARLARLAEDRGAIAALARAVTELAPGDDRSAAVREAVEGVRARITNRLAALRVMGPTASFVGLAGAAAQMSWLRWDHGVLDLDPSRVLGIAVQAGALCMALGIAGSTTAIGAFFFFRPRARSIQKAVDRFGDQLVGATPASWTRATG